MHLNHLIKAIVFPSVPLGELMNMCDFRRIPKIFRPPPYCDISDDPIYSGRGGLNLFGILRKSHMFISIPRGTDEKTMAMIK